eukprot:1154898-Rhodomonas_salina.4
MAPMAALRKGGHLEEIDTKLENMRLESEELFARDQFGNRDKIRTLKTKMAALDQKRQVAKCSMRRRAVSRY